MHVLYHIDEKKLHGWLDLQVLFETKEEGDESKRIRK